MMYRYNEFDERRVVIYARVSTEHEAQISALSNQLEWYQQYLDHHPEWNLIDRYIDEGITGTSAEKRPGFTQMIADAKAHKFDLIITREVSRFARNTEETLHFTKMLRRIGVEVFFINDNIKTFDGDGELRLTIMASLAQDESRKTSIRVKSGQQISMEKGVFYGNGNILGYDRVEKIVEGNKKQVDFNINPVQAETVRRIFDMYLEGHGLMAIKNEMERTGRRTATGLPNWHCTGISQTLKNSFYCGIITYHKEYTPDFLVQKKVKNYGEMALTQVQGRHEPIITVEEYERVQKIMKSKTGKLKNPTTGRKLTGVTPPKTVWGRLMICSCGRRFNRRKWRTNANGEKFFGYQCYGTTQTGTIKSRLKRGLPVDGICQSPMIAEWKLQMMANYIFRHFLTNKQKVLEIANSLLEEHIGDTEVQVQDNSKLIEQKQRELDRANTKRRNLVDLLSNCDISREDYQEARADVDRQIDKLKAEIEELTPVVEPTEEEEIDYESKITILRYALEQYTNFDTDGDIPESVIEAFVEKIEVSKDCFRWHLRGDFGGDSPIPMNVEGNRKKGATISPQYIIPPANFGDSGCHQRIQIIRFIKQNYPSAE